MNASPLPHVAVVLAAGGSRRLGQPKQLLKRDGETLVHRAVRLALETKPQRVLLVVGGHAQAMRDAVADLDVEVVMNAGWEEGLASSVRAAAVALAGNQARCLLLACDQPALQHSHLQQLLEGGFSLDERFDESLLEKAKELNVRLLDGLQGMLANEPSAEQA